MTASPTASPTASSSAGTSASSHAARAAGQAAARAGAANGQRSAGRAEGSPADAFAELLQNLGEEMGLGSDDEAPQARATDREDTDAASAALVAGVPATPHAPPAGMDSLAQRAAANAGDGRTLAPGELLQAALESLGPAGRGRGADEAAGRLGLGLGASAPRGQRSDAGLRGVAAFPGLPKTGAADAADAAAMLQAAGTSPQGLAAPVTGQAGLAALRADERAGPLPVGLGAEAAFALQEPRPLDAAPAPMQAELGSKPGDAAFADELSAQVQLMLDGGLDSAELRMNPAELGPIRISLAVNEQTAEIRFEAANASTREGIERSLPELRDMLAQEGLSLGQAHVGQGGTQGGWNDPRGGAAPRAGTDGGERQRGGMPAQEVPPRPRALRGTLDLYA